MGRLGLLAIPALLWTGPLTAQELPATLSAMLREATPQERNTLRDIAKRLYPEQRKQIDDLIDAIEKDEKSLVQESRFTEGWTGEGSLGGNYSSGNTDKWDFSLGLDIRRKGPLWEHRLEADIDFTETNAQRTEERISAAYRVRRDFARSPFFAFGALSYDRDPFQSILRRFTESGGIGYELIDTPAGADDEVDWDIYAGPALRQTDFADETHVDQFGAFIATDLKWEITDRLTLRQYAGTVLAKQNKSFKATTSLTNNLYGRFSARFEFTFEGETDPPLGAENTDVFSRVSFSYEF